VVPAGQTSPVQVDPTDISVRADGAVGLGYRYVARGSAVGQVAGVFVYREHGYLYFADPRDPSTMVGSRFVSGVFSVTDAKSGKIIDVADTSPDAYTSGIRTSPAGFGELLSKNLHSLLSASGPLTYGYFTFTDDQGTFTGYATPDFTRFTIRIRFSLP
jgi:hypothetical protein